MRPPSDPGAPGLVVPVEEEFKLVAERVAAEWNDRESSRALVFQRADESLDDGQAAVLAHGTEAKPDALLLTPILVR